jgi:hypothetical protein
VLLVMCKEFLQFNFHNILTIICLLNTPINMAGLDILDLPRKLRDNLEKGI